MDSQSHETLSPEALLAQRGFLEALARRLARSEEQAEDLAQHALLRAVERPPRGTAGLRAWLARVLRHAAWMDHRAASRRQRREARQPRREVPTPDQIVEREELRRLLLDAVLALPREQREAVLLRYEHGLPPREIARRLDCPVETVRTRLKRAHQRLRERLDDQAGGGRERWSFLLTPVLPAPGLGWSGILTAAAILVAAAGAWIWLAPGSDSSPADSVTAAAIPQAADPAPPAKAGAGERVLLPPRGPDRRLRGQVIDRDGNPIPGVRVMVAAEVAPLGGKGESWTIRYAGHEQPFVAELLTTDAEGRFAADEIRADKVIVDLNAILSLMLDKEPGYRAIRGAGWHGLPALDLVLVAEALPPQPAAAAQEPPAELEVAGVVLDRDGQPVPDAVVCFGGLIQTRGDEPFKPFVPQRVEKKGVRSDQDGRFLLVGSGRKVSAWHADFGQGTVDVEDEVEIVLPGLGAIEGGFFASGADSLAVLLDPFDRRSKREWLGSAGAGERVRFAFDRVEPGVHLLELPGKRWVCVTVAPGAPTQVDIPAGRRCILEIRGAGLERMPKWQGGLLPRDAVGSMVLLESPWGGLLEIEDILPGRYLLITRGFLAEVEIRGDRAVADFGSRQIRIQAKPGTNVYLAPPDASDFEKLMCGRVGWARVPESGESALTLPPGRIAVGIERRGLFAEVAAEETAPVVDLTGVLD